MINIIFFWMFLNSSCSSVEQQLKQKKECNSSKSLLFIITVLVLLVTINIVYNIVYCLHREDIPCCLVHQFAANNVDTQRSLYREAIH